MYCTVQQTVYMTNSKICI